MTDTTELDPLLAAQAGHAPLDPVSDSIPDAVGHGIMQGFPPQPGNRVTLKNWLLGVGNQWSFQHVRELIPTAPIKSSGEPWELPRGTHPIGDLRAVPVATTVRGVETFGSLLDATFTDGIAVMHRGHLIFEEYHNSMTPTTQHIAMSMTKSFTATLAGAAIDRGYLKPEDKVTDILPELAGTSFEGATVRHILDNRTGMRQDLNTEEESDRYLEIILWQPPTWSVQTTNVIDFFYALHNNRRHGNEFQYNSIMSNMLGWIVQRAAGTRLHALASEVLWKPMGAECEASITLDGHGNAVTEMGLSATLRDMVRWAEMLRCGGVANGRRVLSQEWVDDTVIPEHDSVEAFKTNGPRMLPMAGAYYRNQWWVARSRENGGVYCALGMNGQIILVHEAAEVVLVKLSCWSEKSPDELAHPTIEGMISLADSLALDKSVKVG